MPGKRDSRFERRVERNAIRGGCAPGARAFSGDGRTDGARKPQNVPAPPSAASHCSRAAERCAKLWLPAKPSRASPDASRQRGCCAPSCAISNGDAGGGGGSGSHGRLHDR